MYTRKCHWQFWEGVWMKRELAEGLRKPATESESRSLVHRCPLHRYWRSHSPECRLHWWFHLFLNLPSNYGQDLEGLRAKHAIEMLYTVKSPMAGLCFYLTLISGSNENSYWDSKCALINQHTLAVNQQHPSNVPWVVDGCMVYTEDFRSASLFSSCSYSVCSRLN